MFNNGGVDSGSSFPTVLHGVVIDDIDEFRHYVCWERRIPYHLLFETDSWSKEKWDEYIKKWTASAY